MKTNRSNNRSLKQNSNRLAAYLATGIGAGIVATPQADAAIIGINVGPSGFNIEGVNAGLSDGLLTDRADFPFNGAGTLYVMNVPPVAMGLNGAYGLTFATGGSYATPLNFSLNASIGSSVTWHSDSRTELFQFTYGTTDVSPNFGPGSYMGFKTAQGNYGWLEVTWDSVSQDFQIYSGAYESVAGVAILAGDTVGGTSAVPEPGQVASSLLLLALGSAGVAIQRRRAKKKQAAAVA